MISTMLLANCLSYGPRTHPDEWGTIAPAIDDDCPNISGTYDNSVESAPENPGGPWFPQREISLMSLLFPLLEDIPATHVRIEQREMNTIDFSVFNDDVLIQSKSVRKAGSDSRAKDEVVEFTCNSLNAVIEARDWFAEGDLSMGVQVYHTYIGKGTDGSLIINLILVTKGVAWLIIPTREKSSYWYRFNQVES